MKKIFRKFSNPPYVADFSEILISLADHETWKQVNLIRSISPERVLANPWSNLRITRVFEAYQNNIVLPPIYCDSYVIDGEKFYIPSDGNHRAYVARLLKKKRIRCDIGGTVICHYEKLFIFQGSVYLTNPDGSFVKLIPFNRINENMILIFKTLDVPVIRTTSLSRRFSF